MNFRNLEIKSLRKKQEYFKHKGHEGHKGYKGKTFGFIRITSFPLCSLVRQDKPGWSSGLKGVHRMKYS